MAPGAGYVPFLCAQVSPCTSPMKTPLYYTSITFTFVYVPVYNGSPIGSHILSLTTVLVCSRGWITPWGTDIMKIMPLFLNIFTSFSERSRQFSPPVTFHISSWTVHLGTYLWPACSLVDCSPPLNYSPLLSSLFLFWFLAMAHIPK